MSRNTPEPNLPVAEVRELPLLLAHVKHTLHDLGYTKAAAIVERATAALTVRATPIPDTSAGERGDTALMLRGANLTIAEIEKRFPNWESFRDLVDCIDCTLHDLRSHRTPSSAGERMREALAFVESWVSQPVGSYSVYALDGLFAMTRDKIAAIPLQGPSGKTGDGGAA